MRILVTSSAGFIGATLTQPLPSRGDRVRRMDNHNTSCNPALEEARLAQFANHQNYARQRADLADRSALDHASLHSIRNAW